MCVCVCVCVCERERERGGVVHMCMKKARSTHLDIICIMRLIKQKSSDKN